jgi:hypothetical protein
LSSLTIYHGITDDHHPSRIQIQHQQCDQGSIRDFYKVVRRNCSYCISNTIVIFTIVDNEDSFNETSKGTEKIQTSCRKSNSVTLGDNPAVTKGLPLALDWDHVDSNSYNLEDFEKRKKRTRVMRIPAEEREARLREMGHSKDSFNKISQEIEQIKTSRRESKKVLSPMDEYRLMANVSLFKYRLASREASKRALEENAAKKASRWNFPFFVRRNITF